MKKIIVLILVMFTFFGCGDELEFNTPSFQAKKDGNLWEAVTFNASINTLGELTIFATDNFETISLKVNSTALGLHDVTETTSTGSIIDINDIVFSTNNFPDPSVQLYPAGGIIDLKEVNVEGNYVSGEFYFNGFNGSGITSINVNEGFFFRVPLSSVATVIVDVDFPCTSATASVAATAISFNAAMPGDANFVAVCTAYETALANQKASCGDTDGSIQAIIDGLSCM